MNTHADKTTETKSNAVANGMAGQQSEEQQIFKSEDNRPEAIAQRKIQEAANNSEQVKQLKALQEMANSSPQVKQLRNVQAMADNDRSKTLQLKENKTGIESLAGTSLDNVKLPYNSPGPVQLQAVPANIPYHPNVVQRVIIGTRDVNQETNMPSWEENDGSSYHINLTTDTSHVSKEGSPMIHYFFTGTGMNIKDTQPSKKERGGRSKKKVKGVKGKVKTKTVFSALPAGVQQFIKANWDAILG